MKKFALEFRWAFIFIVMMLLWMLLEKMAGLHDVHLDKHATYTNFVAIPAMLIYFFALRQKRIRDYGGYMTWTQGFISGIIISLIVGVLTPLMQYITATIITPDYFANVTEFTVSTGKMTLADAEAFFNLKNYIIQSSMAAPMMGIFTSAFVAMFTMKKEKKAT